jgi:ribosomal protein S18 acetylase RimI-like enzyme
MMVAADWRGRGVGTALVAAAIEWARARGLHKLTLSVFPHNEAAVALYRKLASCKRDGVPSTCGVIAASSGT